MAGKNISKTTESIISIIILMLLTAVGFMVFYVRKGFEPEMIGFEVENKVSESNEKAYNWQLLGGDGFEISGGGEFYNADTLYEKINGKAPFYIEAGFKSLATNRLIDRKKTELWAEIYIYDMGSGINAYSVYSGQKRENAHDLNIIGYGYKTSNALFLAMGNYYVEIIGSQESDELLDSLGKIVSNFEKHVLGGKQESFEISSYFPQDSMVNGSIVVYKNDAFGFSGFNNLFAADYEIDGIFLTAFVINEGKAEKARKLVESYKDYLVKSGFKTINSEGDIWVFEYDGIYEIIFKVGSFMGGVHETFDLEQGDKLASDLFKHLKKIVKVNKQYGLKKVTKKFVDIFPSLCELSGLQVPKEIDGKSFKYLIDNPKRDGKSAVFSRWLRGTAVNTDRYLYTEWKKKGQIDAKMLFDHKKDPMENVNIADLPENQDIVNKLSQLIKNHSLKADL